MHVAVLGAGVVGITTAHFLAEAGHEVTIIDQAPGVARECSAANGAQLSYSYTEVMASPSFLLRLPGLTAGTDAAIHVRPPLTADLIRWGLGFLGQCTRSSAAANTRANLEMAVRSAQLLRDLRDELRADFHYRQAGKLILLSSDRELDDARRASAVKAELGVRANVVSIEEAIDIEPAIAAMAGPYAGAVYSPGDDVGDSSEFAELLAERLEQQRGARFLFETSITGLIREGDTILGVRTAGGDVEADAVVVCLGAWSPALLGKVDVRIRVAPVRGYSLTLPPGRTMPSASVTDYGRRFVVTRLGEKVRIAGYADFVGFSTRKDGRRIQHLLETARAAAPQVADFGCPDNHAWGGYRPMTPDGRPIVGGTRLDGLFVNTGHGTLGWTLALASAERLADAIAPYAYSYRNDLTATPVTTTEASSSVST
ncbi:MAG: FAD-dependent oxidoreductase [Woeseiaceae bacterium]|nr:FAD-dependent oxidoreductase [Woeseiaceae bacterium]